MQADDLAGGDAGPDGNRARAPIGAQHAAHEEVALQVVGLAAVDHDADQQPGRHQRALGIGSSPITSSIVWIAGLAGQLEDHVVLGGGDRHLAAERSRALGDARQHLHALQADADGALLQDALARNSAPRRRACAPLDTPPRTGTPGASRARPSSTASVGNEYGSESMISPASALGAGMPSSTPPSASSVTVA